MSNGTSTNNYISEDRIPEVIDFMRSNFSSLTDVMEDDREVYDLAKKMYSDWGFAEYDEDYFRDYPTNPNNIDTSVDSVNSLLNTEDEAYSHLKGVSKEKLNKVAQEKQSSLEAIFAPSSMMENFISPEESMRSNREDVFGEVLMEYLPEEWQNNLKININNRAAGHNYQIRTKEDKYEIDPNHVYDPGWGQTIGLNILATGVYDLANFYAGAKIAGALRQIPGINKALSWATSRTTGYLGKILPNSKIANQIRKTMGKYIDANKMADQTFTLGQSIGFTHAAWGATESAANQRMNRGKYKDNNGTISPWDTTVDGTIAYGEGVALGTVLGLTNTGFDAVFKYSNPRWLKGQRDLKTITGQVLANPVTKYGSHGITFATLPLIYDKERRKQYVDENGNVKFGQYFGDVMVGSGMSFFYVGASAAFGAYGNVGRFNIKGLSSKKFTTKLTKEERNILRTKVGNLTAGRGKDKAFEEWWLDFTSNDPSGVAILAKLMRGKGKLPITLVEKIKTFAGVRPAMPWNRKSKLYSEKMPDNLNFPKILTDIRNKTKQNIKYENNKKKNLSLQTEESKQLKTSIDNVSSELGGLAPYEFFENTINKSSDAIDMGDGLQAIYQIADKSLKIIDKITIRNNKGDAIGVDNGKLSDDDAFYLQAYGPSVIPAYQGYMDTYLNSQDGKDAYIRRFEVENNNGNKLSEKEAELLISVAKNQVDQLDVIREYYNRTSLQGSTEEEQASIATGNSRPELAPEYQKIVFLDKEGNPVDGIVHSIDKAEAKVLIDKGRALKIQDAKKKNINVQNIPSSSQGNNSNLSELSQLTQEIKNLSDKIDAGEIARENVKVTAKKLDIIKKELGAEMDDFNNTISVDNNILLNKIRNYRDKKDKQIISDGRIDGIKDAIDIWGLAQISPEQLNKWITPVNRLIKHSGKNSFSEITQEDIKKYFDDRIKEKRKKGHLPAIDDGERSSLNNIFSHLSSSRIGAIAENPYTKILTKPYTKTYNEIKDMYKKQNPTLEVFYKGVERIKTIAKDFGKGIAPKKRIASKKQLEEDKGRLSVALELISDFPIRDLEINAIVPKLIVQYPNTGDWYIDFVTPRQFGGARKTLGVPRPIPITEEMAKKLLTMGKTHGMDKELFPSYAKIITKLLQSELGGGITARAFKSQLKIVAERFAGLSDKAIHTLSNGTEIMVNEITIYNVLAGHAKADDKSIQKIYTDKASFGDFFDIAKPILEKVNQGIKKFIAVTPPPQVVPPKLETALGKAAGAVIKTIEKAGAGIILSIEDISNKSDNNVINTVNQSKKVPIKNKAFKDKYVKSMNNEFNRQTEKWSDERKVELVEFYAKDADIIDVDKLIIYDKKSGEMKFNSNADIEDLVLLSEKILAGSQNIIDNKKKFYKIQDNIDKAGRLADAANIPLEDRIQIIKRRFRKTSFIGLTLKESQEYLKEMRLNTESKNKFNWWEEAFKEKQFNQLVKQVPSLAAFSAKAGFGLDWLAGGQMHPVFKILEDKYGFKGLKKLANRLNNHAAHESRVQGYLQEFERKSALYLAPKRLRLHLRQPKARLKKGQKEFAKIKDKLFWLQEDKFRELTEFVELYPQYTDVVKYHADVKKNLIDKVYKIVKTKKETKYLLRINTPESYIAREWYTLWDNIKTSYEDGFKLNMTREQWNTFNKKHPIEWIEDTFYVRNVITKEFKDLIGLDSRAEKMMIRRNQIKIAYDRALEKAGQEPTQKQIDDEMDAAQVDAYNRLINLRDYSPESVEAKTLLTRKFEGPPIVIINDKPVWVWETAYDTIGRSAVPQAAKLSATIRFLPFMLKMKGLPASYKGVTSDLAKIERTGGSIGQYINGMVYSTAGMSKSNLGVELQHLQKTIRAGNHYISRGHLAWYSSAIKNFGLGTSINYSLWGDQQKELAVALYRSLSLDNRMQAKGRGLIQLSIQSMDTGWSADNIWEKMFKAGKFGSSEEVTRLTASFMALLEMPKLADILGAGPSHKKYTFVLDKLQRIYQLSPEEIFLLKEHGFGKVEAVKYNIKDTGLDTKRLRDIVPGNVNFKGKVLTDPYDIAQEQIKLNDLHQKMISMAHYKTQGALHPIFEPYFLQTPFVKDSFMYQKIAMQVGNNFTDILRLNSKHGNWYRSVFGGAGAVGSWTIGSVFGAGKVLMALRSLVTGLPDPNELEDSLWKKFVNNAMKGEFLFYFTPLLKIAKGDLPRATDFVSIVPAAVTMEIATSFFDLIKYAIDELGFKPEGSSRAAKAFNYGKFPLQNIDELGQSLFAYYRNVRMGAVNKLNPYFKRISKLKEWEKTYTGKTNYGKPSVLFGYSEVTPEKNFFNMMFEQSTNYKDIANTMLDMWYALKEMYTRNGYTPDEAGVMATSEVDAHLKRLDPGHIGLTEDGKETGYSKNDEFALFLIKRGENNFGPGDKALQLYDEFKEAKEMYNTRVDSVIANYNYIIRDIPDLKKEKDKKYFSKIKPAEWDDIGIKFNINPTTYEKEDLYLDLDSLTQKAMLKKYGIYLKIKP